MSLECEYAYPSVVTALFICHVGCGCPQVDAALMARQTCSCMRAAFGRPVDEVFSKLSPTPVASASLGQVYKGQLRGEYGGGEVAVKVQRPKVHESVALDLLLMRRFASYCQTFPQVCLYNINCSES